MVDYRWAFASFFALFPMIGTLLSRIILWNWSNLISVFIGFVPPLHFYNFYLVFFKKLDGMNTNESYNRGVWTHMASNQPQSIALGFNRDPRVYHRNPIYFNRLPY